MLRALSSGADWVIVLTDGEDNGSVIELPDIVNCIQTTALDVGLIIMGISADVNETALKTLTNASKRGVYIPARGDTTGINEAFGKVIAVIQGQVIFEDY
jgi:hypothetical protein